MELIVLLLVSGAVLLFIIFWGAVLFLLSMAGGWRRLDRSFRSAATPRGDFFRWMSGQMGIVNYRSVLNVAVSGDGIFLSVMKLFSPFHPGLFIPWDAILSMKQRSVFLKNYVEMEITDGDKKVRLALSGRVLSSHLWPEMKY